MDSEDGPQRFVPVTVRSASTVGKIVIKNAVETWQAYNTWGGYDLYNGPGGVADYNNRSLAVSLDRPYDRQGAYMFLYHERKLIELAERLGLPLAYVTSMDIDADRHLLHGASALFAPGQNRSSDNSINASGEPDCTGGNNPDPNFGCNDGSFGNAYSVIGSPGSTLAWPA